MKRGGQTKYDEERAAIILDAIAKGNTRECAAGLAGISDRTLTTWMKKGREGEEPFSSFASLVKRSERAQESENVGIVLSVARGGQVVRRFTRTDKHGNTTVTEEFAPQNWQAAMTYLERKFGASWAKDAETIKYLQEARDREQGDDQPLDLSKLSEERLRLLNEWLAESEPQAESPE